MTLHSTNTLANHPLSEQEQDEIFDKFIENPELFSADMMAGIYPLDIKSLGNSSLLHYALMFGQLELASFLLKQGLRNSVNNLNANIFDCYFLKINEWDKIHNHTKIDDFINFVLEYKNLTQESIELNPFIVLSYEQYYFAPSSQPNHYQKYVNTYKKLIDLNLINQTPELLLNATEENCPEFLASYCEAFNVNKNELFIQYLKEKKLLTQSWVVESKQLSHKQMTINHEKQVKEDEYYQLLADLIEKSLNENLSSREIRKLGKPILSKQLKRELGVDRKVHLLENIIDAIISKKNIDLFSFLKPTLSIKNKKQLLDIELLCTKYQLKSFIVEKNGLNESDIASLNHCFETMVNYFDIKNNNVGFNELSWCYRVPNKGQNTNVEAAYYAYKQDLIEISNDSSLKPSIFVHEYTHFLQYKLGNDKLEPHLDDMMEIIKKVNNEMSFENWTQFIIESVKDAVKKESLESLSHLILSHFNETFENQEDKLKKTVIFESELKKFLKINSNQDSSNKATINAEYYDEIITTMNLVKNKHNINDSIEMTLFKATDKKTNILANFDIQNQYWSKRIEVHARLNQQHVKEKVNEGISNSLFSEPVMKTITPSLEKFNQLLIENAKLFFNEKKEENKNKFKA